MFGRVLTIVQIVIGLIMTVLNTVFGVQFYGEWEINPEHFGPNTLSSEYYVYDGPNADGKDNQVVNLYDIRTGETKEIFKVDGEQERVTRTYTDGKQVKFMVYDGEDVLQYTYDPKTGTMTSEEFVTDSKTWYILDTEASITLDDGREVYFKKRFGDSELMYSTNGEDFEAIEGTDLARKSGIYSDQMIYVDGVIYGAFTEIKGILCGPQMYISPFEADVDDIRSDRLFSFDPKTKEFKTLYFSKGGKTRVIGYRYGYVYLWKKNKIYKQNLTKGKKAKIYKIQATENVRLSWAGDVLIIFDENNNVVETTIKAE
ncbi:hypothetical protein D6855_08865 [Butyrivibrio sp. CB08]|uniref:hypothetical protein n=1 Tax=Butyrivibrio sp. CB08 TaxID=2364879 RepID=UPI000EAA82DB|nr:hypothetical protein [Butyrivibrio sp. CB08]RKM59884.1 hypothetical protein D6855_08865 [Butyrivibrio sp. CB08]